MWKAICLCLVFSAAGRVKAGDHPAAPALKKLVKDYYNAVQKEDLNTLTPLLAADNQQALETLKRQYHVIFQATRVTIRKLDIQAVSVDDNGLAAGVTVNVEADIANHDGSKAHTQKGSYVILARKLETGWGVAKVMRASDVKLARKLSAAERREMDVLLGSK